MLTLTAGVPAGTVVIAVLPPGYRPELRNIFVVTSGEPPFAARIFIDPNGAITWNGNAANEKDYTSLSGVTFWPE